MKCKHCGVSCELSPIQHAGHVFCCNGCKWVYKVITEGGLDNYYEIEQHPGVQAVPFFEDEATLFDREDFAEKFIAFDNGKVCHLSFILPQIHCSACIWILERLGKLNSGITSSEVNFAKQRLDLVIDRSLVKISEVVNLLKSIGYAPDLVDAKERKSQSHRQIIEIGVAGFCFGNIMLLAFPEYLGLDESFLTFQRFFVFLSLILTIPVLTYAAKPFFESTFHGLKNKQINIDTPIVIGICALFLTSLFSIINGSNEVYFDSLCGLVFFLLVGRWFQSFSYRNLSFERDYKSYFPLSSQKLVDDQFRTEPIDRLAKGDRIRVRNEELIPADCILQSSVATIDYSFVTGESDLTTVEKGSRIYGGGKNKGIAIELEIMNAVNASHLTKLWNNSAFSFNPKLSNQWNELLPSLSTYFTLTIVLLAICTANYWYWFDPSLTWSTFSAVLIVACPCALALSAPLTFGFTNQLLAKNGMFIRNEEVLHQLGKVNHAIFDKTGTLTFKDQFQLDYQGTELNNDEKNAIYSLVKNSLHPLSNAIAGYLQATAVEVDAFIEQIGQGVEGQFNGVQIKVGSRKFVGCENQPKKEDKSNVFVAIDGQYKGCFYIESKLRNGLTVMIHQLKNYCNKIDLLSGDNNRQLEYMKSLADFDELLFDQSPEQKFDYVQKSKQSGAHVAMIGDGLNDAAAIKESDVGIAIADDLHQFSPACDVILKSDKLREFDRFMKVARSVKTILKACLIISIVYNLIGLSFAMSGSLSPLVAAILMPISSISVLLFVYLATWAVARKNNLTF